MTQTTQLTCDMRKDCPGAVTHKDRKGYLYCKAHAAQRKAGGIPCRLLKKGEIDAACANAAAWSATD